MNFDLLHYRYPSRRNLVFSRKGMVGTANPLAAQAGLDMLKKGGNAVDAAIAAAACLTVVEPSSNGLGSDAFAIICMNNQLYGINGSGPAPHAISADMLRTQGHTAMPRYGLTPVTVPGAPATWAALAQRFGQLPLTTALQPAIDYAEQGFAIAPTVARCLVREEPQYQAALAQHPEVQTWFDMFAPNGRIPALGECWRSRELGKSLRLIAESHGEAFYRGEIADAIDAFARDHGGFLRKEDLAAFQPEWVTPLSTNYRGVDVWELPPNGQGMIVLEALNILRRFSLTEKEDVRTYHRQIEALKLAFADGLRYIGDPRFGRVPVDTLLSEAYAQERFALLSDKTAIDPQAGDAPEGGTVYLATADEAGNMVSYIQSNFTGFGSGCVVPGYGISLHNRGLLFNLTPGHINELAPGKRPYHTIIPGFLTKNGKPLGPFGVMGGPLQPQAHVQVLSSMLDFALHPQNALDAPRWQWLRGKKIEVEPMFARDIAQALQNLGHEITYAEDDIAFGRGQIILRNENGVYFGGTEPRADGTLAVW